MYGKDKSPEKSKILTNSHNKQTITTSLRLDVKNIRGGDRLQNLWVFGEEGRQLCKRN